MNGWFELRGRNRRRKTNVQNNRGRSRAACPAGIRRCRRDRCRAARARRGSMRPDLGTQENDNRSLSPSAAQIMTDRDGNLPVWVRAPKRGHEFYSGCSRPKLYDWAGIPTALPATVLTAAGSCILWTLVKSKICASPRFALRHRRTVNSCSTSRFARANTTLIIFPKTSNEAFGKN